MTGHHYFEQPQSGYRGRSSAVLVRHPKRWAVAGLMAAVLFSTAAAATKLHPRLHRTEIDTAAYSLPANVGLRTWGDSFAEVVW